MRSLEPSELYADCPKCDAPKGKPCTLAWCNELFGVNGTREPGVSAVPHVERKRAAGRSWRVRRIVDVLRELRATTIIDRELAEKIDDALHDRSKT